MARVSYKVVISGVVQGVSFRASMRDAALRHGVKGWVRNREDGALEALVQGEDVQVTSLLEWARVGPPGAEVDSLERLELEGYPPQVGFRVLVQG
ncbi:MAG TPA: acylphosphatase [Nitrososphaerales archaeon]|nr:acylphosphatase [Nitrososphaerales archaeon]